MGLGRSALREREERTRKEREDADLARQQSARSLGLLQKFVETEDLLPDSARSAAAQHLLNLSSNPKAKDTDFTKAVQDVWTIANQPRPSASPQSVATEATRRIASADYSGLDAISPFSNMGGAAQDFGRNEILPQLPEPETVSGLLTRDELDERNMRGMERQLALRQKYTSMNEPKAITVEGPDGVYRFDPNGKEIGFTPFRTPMLPKLDTNRTPFEILIDPNATPEQKQIAERWMTLQLTNQGDQFKPSSMVNGMNPAMYAGATVWDSPTGPVLVFPRLLNPGAEPIVSLTDKGIKPQPKEYQSRSRTFYERASGANDVFLDIEKQIAAKGFFSRLWMTAGPEILQSELGRLYLASQKQFTEARLRKDSGAAIPPSEFENDKRMYFPQPGDSDAVIAQKRNARQIVLQALEREGKAAAPFGSTSGSPTLPASAPAPPPPSGFVPVP